MTAGLVVGRGKTRGWKSNPENDAAGNPVDESDDCGRLT